MFSASGIESREGWGLGLEPSEAALRPHEALHRSGQHEEMGLTIRRVILNDLVRRILTHESFNRRTRYPRDTGRRHSRP